MTKSNKELLDKNAEAKNQVNQNKKSWKETATERTGKQLEKNFKETAKSKETSESKENSNKKFEDLKPGDPIYGIKVKFEKDTKPEIINAKVTGAHFEDEDTNEYLWSSVIECQDNNRKHTIYLRKHETSKNTILDSYEYWFLSKEDRDNYLKNNIPKRIESINRDIKSIEERKKKSEARRKRMEAWEFLSLEEEIAYIEDEYDHENGPEINRIMDARCKAEIEAAKKKWANK